MKRFVLLASLAVALNVQSADEAKTRHPASAGKTVVVYTGNVDAQSAARLTDLIGNNTDKVIGLKLTIERSRPSDKRYFTDLDGGQLDITSGDPMDAPVEVLINGPTGTTTAGAFITVDGFYLIKSGGSHAAGALSYGAIPVDEATIRLNPNVHMIRKPF